MLGRSAPRWPSNLESSSRWVAWAYIKKAQKSSYPNFMSYFSIFNVGYLNIPNDEPYNY